MSTTESLATASSEGPVEETTLAVETAGEERSGEPGTTDGPGFADLGLSETVLKAVRDLRYSSPTPVQAAAIPAVLEGRDLLAAAQTGTGKTAAFLLPTLNNLGHVVRPGRDRKRARGRGPLMLIITPTRELAQQIDEVCTKIAARTRHIAVTVVGGVGYNPQRSALKRGCDVLVATPGRLVDLIEQGACHLDEVSVLVLDEADRMLDMGFLPQVRRIVDQTPAERQTLLFSATLDEKAVGSITDLVDDPARVEIAPATSTADTVDQYVLPVSLEAKNALLAQVLKKEGASRVIVFCRTKHRADACCRRLGRAGISAAPIHGDRTQAQRERALKAFRNGETDVLVATDVLSRGIDISDVRYVVNFDVPVEPTDYIHRIGRTGRAGELGWALTFVTSQDVSEFYAIEGLMKKTADIYDADGLELGEEPPTVDPDRVPGRLVAKRKTKRGKSTSKRRRGGSSAGRGEGERASRPARPKRAGRTRVREEVAGAAEPASRQEGAAPSAEPTRGADHGNWSRHDARRAREGAADAERGRRLERTSRAGAERGTSGKRAGGKRGAEPSERRGRGGKKPQGRVQHDWRNSDLPEERGRRGGRAGRPAARDGKGDRAGRGAARQSTRRPGDRGGK